MSQKLIIHITTNEWDLIRPNINYQDQQDEYQLKHRCRYRNNTRVQYKYIPHVCIILQIKFSVSVAIEFKIVYDVMLKMVCFVLGISFE